jgi:hypothetical protein
MIAHPGQLGFADDRTKMTGKQMPKGKVEFDIDDDQTVDQNIAEFTNRLATIDPALAAILGAELPALSNDMDLDQGAILNALYAATAPVPEPDQDGAVDMIPAS